MKHLALSIRQPWAWAILNSNKRHENRTWSTRYRGPILIHAAKGLTRDEYKSFLMFYEHEINYGPPYPPSCPPMAALERGGIVGRARIVDCVKASDSPWFGGPYAFVLDDVHPMPFIPYRGELGLFEVPDTIFATGETVA